MPISRGDCTVRTTGHGGPGGNSTAGFRRAYICAFRSAETVAAERALGFTHSHNDATEVLDVVGIDCETRLA